MTEDGFLGATPASMRHGLTSGRVLTSPDRHTLLLSDFSSDQVLDSTTGRRVRKELNTHRFCPSGPSFWMPDSRRWVRQVQIPNGHDALDAKGGLYALVQTATPSDKGRLVGLGLPRGALWGIDCVASRFLGSISAEEMLATTGVSPHATSQRAQQVRFYSFSLVRPNAPAVREYSVTLPQNVALGDVALSPDGKRLVWSLFLTSGSGISVNRNIPQVSRLAVSARDGSHFVTLGELPLPGGVSPTKAVLHPTTKTVPGVEGLHWTSDGSHVRFRYAGAVWMAALRQSEIQE